MSLQWEPIELANQLAPQSPYLGTWIRTERAKVIGGWLVRAILVKRDIAQVNPASAQELEIDTSIGLTFIPDPQLAWRLG